jgi:hypothetical protein
MFPRLSRELLLIFGEAEHLMRCSAALLSTSRAVHRKEAAHAEGKRQVLAHVPLHPCMKRKAFQGAQICSSVVK